jgi:hypothetical protein
MTEPPWKQAQDRARARREELRQHREEAAREESIHAGMPWISDPEGFHVLSHAKREHLADFLDAHLPEEDDDQQRQIFNWARALTGVETAHQGANLMMLQAGEEILKQLARTYADHEDYRDEWLPA